MRELASPIHMFALFQGLFFVIFSRFVFAHTPRGGEPHLSPPSGQLETIQCNMNYFNKRAVCRDRADFVQWRCTDKIF